MTARNPDLRLAASLGLKRGMRCWFHNMPDSVRARIDPEQAEVEEQATATDGLQCAHIFVPDRAKLERELAALGPLMAPNGFIWVSWPSVPESDLSDDAVRDAGGRAGLVDVAACLVTEDYAGIRLETRKEAR